MDPHIFPDPDPGSQNLVDPTDPKQWFLEYVLLSLKNDVNFHIFDKCFEGTLVNHTYSSLTMTSRHQQLKKSILLEIFF